MSEANPTKPARNKSQEKEYKKYPGKAIESRRSYDWDALPELVVVTDIAGNVGRFATAATAVLVACALFTALGASDPRIGALNEIIYRVGLPAISVEPR